MTINEMRFLYGDFVSDEYGLILCDFGSANTDSNDEESSIVMTTTPYKETWDYHYKQKSAPLKFPITVAKANGEFIDADEEREIKKGLCKNKFDWFKVDQDDLSNIEYYAIISNPRKVDVGRRNAGISFDIVCNCGHAWSNIKKKKYETLNGTLNFKFNNITDFDDYILSPIFIITPTSNGTISIKNNTTNRTMTINNCALGEVITIDNKTDKLESSNGRVLINDWNKQTIEFLDGSNSVTLTGNFKLEINFRLPIRVGG